MWDTASHQHKMINGEMGDIACDSYHKFREDIKLLKKLKVRTDFLNGRMTHLLENSSVLLFH